MVQCHPQWDIKPGLTGSGSCKSHCDVPAITMAPVDRNMLYTISTKRKKKRKKKRDRTNRMIDPIKKSPTNALRKSKKKQRKIKKSCHSEARALGCAPTFFSLFSASRLSPSSLFDHLPSKCPCNLFYFILFFNTLLDAWAWRSTSTGRL